MLTIQRVPDASTLAEECIVQYWPLSQISFNHSIIDVQLTRFIRNRVVIDINGFSSPIIDHIISTTCV